MTVPFYIYIILLSFLASLLSLRRRAHPYLMQFVPYLLFTLATEVLGVYYKYRLDQPNGWLYNIYLLAQVAFLSSIFRKLIRHQKMEKYIKSITLVFFVFVFVYYLFFGSIRIFDEIIFVSGGFSVTLMAVFFVFYYFMLDNPAEEKMLLPFIFITAGIIIYFSVAAISISLHKYIQYHQLTIGDEALYNLIPRILCVIMYSLFTYAFIYASRKN